MKRLVLLAPAKINLCLHVLGKRPDGYHEVAMLMQRVSLYDRVEIALSDRPGITVSCENLSLAPAEENIAARAARRLLARSNYRGGVTICIDKQIPVAAGLGGGSSDAAAVLRGLNELLDLRLTDAELRREGLALGADVPFFLGTDAAWAGGVGEILTPAPPLPPLWYLLVNPGIAVSTAWVYQNLGLTGASDLNRLPRFPGTVTELVAQLHNDLERVTIARYPQIGAIKERLLALGAAGALMSGSGATVFGVFADEDRCQAAAAQLRGESDWRIYPVRPAVGMNRP